MPKHSAKQRKLRGRGKIGGPHFMQFFHYVKRSTSYHGLSLPARALLTEIHDRYNGCNNGMIVLGVREAEYELRCGHATVCRAMREVDDAGLARPTQLGAWRGRHATEWRLMWRRCDKTGDLPRSVWVERKPYVQLLLPAPAKVPLTDAERARRYRRRKTDRHEDRHDEFHRGNAEVPLQIHRRDVSSATDTRNGNSSIDASRPSSATDTHVHIYQGQGDDAKGEE
jgi:hypothetical protein